MPKYRLTNEDMFKPNLCPICGNDIFDEDAETCCWECESIFNIFKEDYEENFYENEYLEDELEG